MKGGFQGSGYDRSNLSAREKGCVVFLAVAVIALIALAAYFYF